VGIQIDGTPMKAIVRFGKLHRYDNPITPEYRKALFQCVLSNARSALFYVTDHDSTDSRKLAECFSIIPGILRFPGPTADNSVFTVQVDG
jgi:hypothetical protein